MSASPHPPRPVPALALLLGYGPALLVVALAVAAWTLPVRLDRGAAATLFPQAMAAAAGWLFATAILLFLAGVTRGLSFSAPGGARPAQLAMTVWLFLLGFGALSSPLSVAFVLLILGYGSVAAFDPPAARAGLAPDWFARLRPGQMLAFVAGLGLLLARVLHN